MAGFDGSSGALVALKHAASLLIGRFAAGAVDATRARTGAGPLHRYDADLVVPRELRAQCALLKGIALRYVMRRAGRGRALCAGSGTCCANWWRPWSSARRRRWTRSSGRCAAAPATTPRGCGWSSTRSPRSTDPAALAWHARLVPASGVAVSGSVG